MADNKKDHEQVSGYKNENSDETGQFLKTTLNSYCKN